MISMPLVKQVAATGFGVTDRELLEESEKDLSKRVPLRWAADLTVENPPQP